MVQEPERENKVLLRAEEKRTDYRLLYLLYLSHDKDLMQSTAQEKGLRKGPLCTHRVGRSFALFLKRENFVQFLS